jgi:8-oxo-dGTP diphosphatase
MKDSMGRTVNAGAIVFNDENEILVDYRTRQDDYSFPKGHVEDGETIQEAAVREVKEEMGCDIELLEELLPHEYDHKKFGRIICHMFLARLISCGEKSEKNDNPVWMKLDELDEKLTYENNKTYTPILKGKLN